jgi:hypothetical protein
MAEIIRHCPDCGLDRSITQHHGLAGRCPDSPDLCCPEWYCVTCGAALLIGDIPVVLKPACTVGLRDRVA